MTDDLQKSTRLAYADALTEFTEQREWYSKRAGELKKKTQRLDLLVITFGALIAAIPILKTEGAPELPDIAVSFLGAAVAIAQGAQRIYRYAETWPEFRLASERMKRENRLFLNSAPPYDCEEGEAKETLILRLEGIIAEEQKIFFDKAKSDETKDSKNER